MRTVAELLNVCAPALPEDVAQGLNSSRFAFLARLQELVLGFVEDRISEHSGKPKGKCLYPKDVLTIVREVATHFGEEYQRISAAYLQDDRLFGIRDPHKFLEDLGTEMLKDAFLCWTETVAGLWLAYAGVWTLDSNLLQSDLLGLLVNQIEDVRRALEATMQKRLSTVETNSLESTETGTSPSPAGDPDSRRGVIRTQWLDSRLAGKTAVDLAKTGALTYNTVQNFRSGKNVRPGTRLALAQALTCLGLSCEFSEVPE